MAIKTVRASKDEIGFAFEGGDLKAALDEWKRCLSMFERAETKAETEFAVMQLEAARRKLFRLREDE